MNHLLDAGPVERRNPRQRLSYMLLEVIPVIREKLELEIIRDIAERPRYGVGLIAADHQAADLFLEIGAPVGIAHRCNIGCQAFDLFGDDIVMLDRLQRHAHPRHRSDLARPLAGAIHRFFASNRALVRLNRNDATIGDLETGDANAFDEPCAMHARTLGKRLRNVGGVRLAIGRKKSGADEIGHIHERPHRFDLGGRQEMHLHAEALRGGGEPLELDPAILVAGKPEAAGHLPAGGESGLLVEPFVEVDRIFEHLGDRG